MKIFNASQIYEADACTVKVQGIASHELMERAALQIFNWMDYRMQGAPVKIHLFCGIGNNGGDGIALARHLQEHGYNIKVFVVNYSDKRSKDFLLNLERLKDRKVWPTFLNSDSEFPEIDKDDIIVDAIFGIGLNRALCAWVANLIQYLNKSDAFILSIDIPSGLYLDKYPENTTGIINAGFVLSFQAPKLVFFLPQTGVYLKQWAMLDIGLDAAYIANTKTDYEFIDKIEVLSMYMPRDKFSHKGTYGHSLMIGGSHGKIGAMILASNACLHSGSGLVTAYVPNCGYVPLQTALPEIMVITDENESWLTDIVYDIVPTVVSIGMGMGKKDELKKTFSSFIANYEGSLVIDADGLNLLSESKVLLKKLPSQAILTPHPKELERLIGVWKDDFDKLKKAKKFSSQYDCVLVIKGAHTIVVYENVGYVNSTGNPGMATAGSGDALTGVITGLVAQGYEPLKASILGVYLHGKAADIAVEKFGYQSLTASRIIDHIGSAYIDLLTIPKEPQPENEDKD
ncbi:MAG: bifunctional ADP-dependent NAD(P)H-hydrate dehydratase/NAD(P)H-hydrate epimerase [Flavobacteriaceae bacterium]|nr:MAG: bifunctional ADP-dependent NAD(P)H-hydrate dehydratase/NAD(P)H-hydrate epimerase [Flavobacteriaceae bacterium]